jgi:hypothetical protein
VQYDLDVEYEEMDFYELMQVLMMGKQFEEPKFRWGKTRAEVIEEIKEWSKSKRSQSRRRKWYIMP